MRKQILQKIKQTTNLVIQKQRLYPKNKQCRMMVFNSGLMDYWSKLHLHWRNQLLTTCCRPGHSNGAGYHASGIDAKIEQLSTAEAIHVIHRIEGAGFGQTGDGYAGIDTPESHRNFVSKQINNRFDGSVHQLLRKWGTYSYGGY